MQVWTDLKPLLHFAITFEELQSIETIKIAKKPKTHLLSFWKNMRCKTQLTKILNRTEGCELWSEPPGRRVCLGLRAAGLLLAKPFHCHISIWAFDQARGQDGWILVKLLFYMCLWTASVCFMFALASEIFFLAEHSVWSWVGKMVLIHTHSGSTSN